MLSIRIGSLTALKTELQLGHFLALVLSSHFYQTAISSEASLESMCSLS